MLLTHSIIRLLRTSGASEAPTAKRAVSNDHIMATSNSKNYRSTKSKICCRFLSKFVLFYRQLRQLTHFWVIESCLNLTSSCIQVHEDRWTVIKVLCNTSFQQKLKLNKCFLTGFWLDFQTLKLVKEFKTTFNNHD